MSTIILRLYLIIYNRIYLKHQRKFSALPYIGEKITKNYGVEINKLTTFAFAVGIAFTPTELTEVFGNGKACVGPIQNYGQTIDFAKATKT